MRMSSKQLQRVIKEELAAVLSVDALPVSLGAEMGGDVVLEEEMMGLLACLRSASVWFHAAHHVTKGTGFIGDHKDLYGEIYDSLNGDYDGAAEKAVGLTGSEDVVCPHAVMSMALEKMEKYPSPSGASAASIASTGLEIMRDLNAHVEDVFSHLEASGQLALGLNDFLAAAANDYTKYIYLLQQRTRG